MDSQNEMESTALTNTAKSKTTSSEMTDQRIYREIFDAIVQNRLSPGSRLNQDELCKIFGISKTRLRPVLYQLAQQKIVDLEPNRGAFVATPSITDAQEINAARQILEGGIVRTLTPLLDDAQLQELDGLVRKEKEARMNNDLGTAHALSGYFHIKLAEYTGNGVIVDVLRQLISRDTLAVAIYQPSDAAGCSIHDHSELVNILASKDVEAAVECMTSHLQHIADSLSDELPESNQQLRKAFGHLSAR